MYITVKQLCGKFFSQVRNAHRDGGNILFESPEYLTEAMAHADAKCWLAFHGEETKVSTYVLAYDPIDAVGGRRPLKGEYVTKEDAWAAVQRTFFNEPVTVLEDGEPVATFYWGRQTDEPHPTRKGYVRPVRNLCKWTRAGWQPTGVQSVGNGKLGKGREIRTVKV